MKEIVLAAEYFFAISLDSYELKHMLGLTLSNLLSPSSHCLGCCSQYVPSAHVFCMTEAPFFDKEGNDNWYRWGSDKKDLVPGFLVQA